MATTPPLASAERASSATPAPAIAQSAPKRQNYTTLKWSLFFSVLVFAAGGWWFVTAMMHGRSVANAASRRFHEEYNTGAYDQMFANLSPGMSSPQKHAALLAFLKTLNNKLGDAGEETMTGINITTTTANGTVMTVIYNTTFARGKAVETFAWIKNGDSLKLNGYHVNSDALAGN
jgi:hypothetical protein